jgi:hypothetical protein
MATVVEINESRLDHIVSLQISPLKLTCENAVKGRRCHRDAYWPYACVMTIHAYPHFAHAVFLLTFIPRVIKPYLAHSCDLKSTLPQAALSEKRIRGRLTIRQVVL